MINLNKIFTLLAFVCFVFTTKAETEPNNTWQTADVITFNGSDNGYLDQTDVVDWYRISTQFNAAIELRGIFDDTLTARIELYDMNLNLLDSSSSGTDTLYSGFQCAHADSFLIKVVHRTGKGNYTLKTTFKIPLVLLSETEPNNTQGNRVDFTTGNASGMVGAHLGYVNRSQFVDQTDWFRFISTKNGQLNFNTTIDSSLKLKVTLYNDALSAIGASAADKTGEHNMLFTCMAPDTFFVKIEHHSGCGSYQIEYVVDTPAVAADIEPNDTRLQAIWLNADTTLSGHVGLVDQFNNTDQFDWYGFKPKQDGKVTITAVFDSTITGNMFLINRLNGQVISPVTGTDTQQMVFMCAASDSFFVRVFGFNGCGGYTLKYDLDTPVANNDVENNDTKANATVLSSLNGFEGHIGYINSLAKTDTTDWFKLPITDRLGRFKLTVVLDSGLEAAVVVYDSLLNPLTSTSFVKDTVIRELNCLQGEAHYVRIRRNIACGGYVANLETLSVGVPNDIEPNNSSSTAQPITTDTFYGHSGFIDNGLNNKFDYFSLNMTKFEGNCFKFTAHQGGQYQLAVLDSNGGSISGSSAQGDTFTLSNFVPLYTGKYILRLENGSNTCSDYTISREYLINNLGITKPTSSVCINDFVNMSAIFTGQVPDSVEWEFEDAVKLLGFGFNVSPQFTSSGWKKIVVKAYNCAGTFAKTDSIYISPEPTSGFTFAISGNDVIFTNTSTDYDSVAWFFDDGNTSEQISPTHQYAVTGKYNVCLQAFNNCGNNVFCDTVSAIGVGVGTIDLPSTVSVYPNPAGDVLNIDLSQLNETATAISIISISGVKVYSTKEVNDITTINTSLLPAGNYILLIKSGENIYRTRIAVE